MKHKLFTAILLLFFFSSSWGQSFKKIQLLKGIDVYRDSILQRHPDPFTKISRKEFIKEIATLKKQAKQLDEDELLTRLMQINAKINDELTGLYFNDPEVLAMQVYWFEDGMYIIKAQAAYKRILGGKVLKIGGMPIAGVIEKITQIVPGGSDPTIRRAVPQFIISPDILHGLKIISTPRQVPITVMKANGDTETLVLPVNTRMNMRFARLELAKVPLRYSAGMVSNWYRYDSSTHLMYYNFSEGIENKAHPYSEFEHRLIGALDSSNASKLVIDIRDNSGTQSNLLHSLIEKLAVSHLNRKGGIYVLIGNRTDNGALKSAMELKQKTHALFIGEPTATNPNGFIDPHTVTLPGRMLSISFATAKLPAAENYEIGITPDVTIPEKFSDFIKGKDAALEYVMAQ